MSKRDRGEYPGSLAEPITIPLATPVDATGRVMISPVVFRAKLELLARHFGLATKGDWGLALACALAKEHVPGFQFVYDDPLAASLGLPMKSGAKSGRAGTAPQPFLSGIRLIELVRIVKMNPSVKTDVAAIHLIMKGFFPELKHSGRRNHLQKALIKRLQSARKVQRENSAPAF